MAAHMPNSEVELSVEENTELQNINGANWLQLEGPVRIPTNPKEPRQKIKLGPQGIYRFAYVTPTSPRKILAMQIFIVESGRDDSVAAIINGPSLSPAGERVVLRLLDSSKYGSVHSAKFKRLDSPKLRLKTAPKTISFVPNRAGLYRFAVTAQYEAGRAPTAIYSVYVPANSNGGAERRPVAKIKPVASIKIGEHLTLDASKSFDPDGGELVYIWRQLGGSTVAISELSSFARVHLINEGRYIFELTVRDSANFVSKPSRVEFDVSARFQKNADNLLTKRISFEFNNAPLNELIELLAERNINIRFDSKFVKPLSSGELRTDFWAVNMSVADVLDWLARSLGAYYVVEAEGAIWISANHDWYRNEPLEFESYRIDALASPKNWAEIETLLINANRLTLWTHGDANIGTVNTASMTISPLLPKIAHRKVDEIITELRSTTASGIISRTSNFPKLKCEPLITANFKDTPLREMLRNLSQMTETNIGFAPLGRDGGEKVTLTLENQTLEQAVCELIKITDLKSYVVDSKNTVWLDCMGALPASAECLLTSGITRSYDLSVFQKRHGLGGNAILHIVKSRVKPHLWRDISAFIGFSKTRNRLIAIHTEDTHALISQLLARLADEGFEMLITPSDN